MPQMPKSPPFKIRTYFVYNLKLHAWLSKEGQWTQSLECACPFTNEDAAIWTQPPAGCDVDDLFTLASDAEFDDAREDTIGPTMQNPAWYKAAVRG
jgi:hypothetical protein